MDFGKIEFYIKGINWVFGQMPLKMEVGFIFALLMFVGMFYFSVISPIIFNYFLIPKIEKKIGKKLDYHPFIDYIFLGKWMCRQEEIALYLINRYWAMKFKGDYGLPKYCLRFGLKKAGYTINMASKLEIVMSFLLLVSTVVTVISAIIALIASSQLSIR